MMKVYPFALACLMLAIVYALYMKYIYFLGFPDGYIAELDGAERELATWFNWFCLAMCVWFLRLGRLSFRGDIKQKLSYSCLVFVVVMTATLALDQYFRGYMMDSRGG